MDWTQHMLPYSKEKMKKPPSPMIILGMGHIGWNTNHDVPAAK